MQVHEENAQLKETIKTLQAAATTNAALALDIASANSQIAALKAELAALETSHASEISKFTVSITNLSTRAEKAEADLKAEKDGFENKASLRAQEILAATGAKAPLGSKTNANPATGKADFSQLKGLAKATAIHAAENQKN